MPLNQLYITVRNFLLFILLSFTITARLNGQKQAKILSARLINNSAGADKDVFGKARRFVQNVGQYGDYLSRHKLLGKIQYGYEDMGLPVLFTNHAIIHLHRKEIKQSYGKKEKRNEREPEEERDELPPLKMITMEWVNANPAAVIQAEDEATGYHIYGTIQQPAKGYRKLIIKDIYPAIDVVYSFISGQAGYEYSLIIRPGGNIEQVKLQCGGDIKKVYTDNKGQLVLLTETGGIIQSTPVGFYEGEKITGKNFIAWKTDGRNISFSIPENFDKNRTYVIDPFVSPVSTFSGANGNVSRDIDFDYSGNIYVAGGGSTSAQMLAKYDPAGTLLWTFSGTVGSPTWSFGPYYGGWVVDKPTGNIFMAQGLTSAGFSVIRLNSLGVYDNYITTPNANFLEGWRMIWSCNNGNPRILIAGGGGSANNELAVLSPPNVTPTASNLSGLSGGHNDISDITIDPVTNDMFTVYSIPVTNASSDNIIYKHPPPYTSSNIGWQVTTGFFALHEPSNRPYTTGFDNSTNTLAVNSQYLFYWDGKNLKAINKQTGATAGTPFSSGATGALFCGGVFADECGNVFVGNTDGTIKVLKFDGTTFDDAAIPDIPITGFAGKSVFDLAFDNAHKLLYACGNGFVASIDVAPFCPSTLYNVNAIGDCFTQTCTANVSPVPPPGTTVTYSIYDGATLVASNSTGVFTGLAAGITYTIRAFLNQACGGLQAITTFSFSTSSAMVVNNPPAVCLLNGGADLTAASVTAGTPPGFTYTYWMDVACTIPMATPTTAPPGTYYIKGTLSSGVPCGSVKPVVVPALPVPVANAGEDITICYGKDAQLNAAAGAMTYSWSPVKYLDNPAIPNPTVINPPPGVYTYFLTITDASGCKSAGDESVQVTVIKLPRIQLANEVVIARNQPLQLNAQLPGVNVLSYTWTPTTGLSDPFIQNPIAIVDHDIMYKVTATAANDCSAEAYIRIKVYEGPEIYVPSAFTPSPDGLNDVLKAIPVGIVQFRYFTIYNRWGQVVFTTSNPSVGWDGKIGGVKQSSAVYVWMAEGIDYKGRTVSRQGTVTLIR